MLAIAMTADTFRLIVALLGLKGVRRADESAMRPKSRQRTATGGELAARGRVGDGRRRDAAHHARNRIEQHLVVERLAEIRRDTGGEASGTRLRLVVGGDDDRREPRPDPGEGSLDLEPGQPGHLQIEDQTIRLAPSQGVEKFLSRGIDDGVEVGSQEQPSQGLADRFLVVDDSNHGSGTRHAAAPLLSIVAKALGARALDQSRIALRPRTNYATPSRPGGGADMSEGAVCMAITPEEALDQPVVFVIDD